MLELITKSLLTDERVLKLCNGKKSIRVSRIIVVTLLPSLEPTQQVVKVLVIDRESFINTLLNLMDLKLDIINTTIFSGKDRIVFLKLSTSSVSHLIYIKINF